MDKYEIRRLRLIELMNTLCNGKLSEIAKKIERSDSYVSRMMYPEGKPGKKRIGEDMADLITRTFGLPPTWLDGEPTLHIASEQAKEVARAFDLLTQKQQEAVITMIESYGPTISRIPREAHNETSNAVQVDSGRSHTTQSGPQKQSFGSS